MESICNISTHYNRMRLLAEMKLNKEFLVDQHITYLDIIKNKDSNIIDEVVSHHIKEPVGQWKKLIKEESEISKYIVY